MEEILAVLVMFLLRLGVPLVITLAVGYGLRRLDARWQTDAQARLDQEQEEVSAELKALKTAEKHCWEIKGCDEASKAQCPACKFWDIPCWAAHLRATGRLPATCPDCELFSLSPAA